MFFQLTGVLKRKFIWELRKFWMHHPRYSTDLVDNIQGKYSFRERPQYGIIVKTGSASEVRLSADNYKGVVNSYVYLTKAQQFPGLFVNWVREDSVAIQNNNGVFPSPPGVYFLELVEKNEFVVVPILDVFDEAVMMISSTEGQLLSPFIDGTLRLYEMPSGYKYQEGLNYIADPSTGLITLTRPLAPGTFLMADYRKEGTPTGPFPLLENYANNTAIPGCVIAFGDWNKKGDRVAIVVQETRLPSALEYGGRWDLTVDFDVMARDNTSQQYIADWSVQNFQTIRNRLSAEGYEIMSLDMGGESEEIYDETGDDYFYNSTFSMTIQTEWSVHVPLNVTLRNVSPLTVEQAQFFSTLSDEEITQYTGNIQALESLGLQTFTDPFYVGQNPTFETIS